MQIRQATSQDVQQVSYMYEKLQESLQYLRKIKLTKSQMKKRFNKSDMKNIFVVEEKNKLIGFIRISETKQNEWCGKCAELEEIFILNKYQGKGIGIKLIEKTKERTNKLCLMTHPKNQKAVKFYKKLGFKTIGLEMSN